MSETPETKFKNAAQAFLKTLGPDCWWFKVLGGPGQKSGVPDIIGCFRGKFFAPELKSKKGKPDQKQLYEIEKITRAGGAARVIYDDIEEFKEFMDQVA